MEQLFTSQTILSPITSKGQITLPRVVRKHLGVTANDMVAFVIKQNGMVTVETPLYSTVASIAGVAGKLQKKRSWQTLRKSAREEHIAHKAK